MWRREKNNEEITVYTINTIIVSVASCTVLTSLAVLSLKCYQEYNNSKEGIERIGILYIRCITLFAILATGSTCYINSTHSAMPHTWAII